MNDFDDVADGDFAVLIYIGLFADEGRRLSLKQIIYDAHDVRYADRAINAQTRRESVADDALFCSSRVLRMTLSTRIVERL